MNQEDGREKCRLLDRMFGNDDGRIQLASPSPREADRLKVLYIDNSFRFGGAIESLRQLVNAMRDWDVEPVVVSCQSPESLESAFPEVTIESVDVPVRWRDRTALYRLALNRLQDGIFARIVLKLAALDWHLRRTLPSALRYARIGFAHGIDLVHLNNNLEGQLEGLLGAKMLGVPCVAHARGFQEPTRVLRMIAPRVDRHIAISAAIRENLCDIGTPEHRISLIHNTVDFDRFESCRDPVSVREELGVPADASVFGFFGRIIGWKGVREFVQAATEVLGSSSSAYALIVGDESDGAQTYFRKVERLGHESHVAERILFTGYRSDVPSVMQAIDVIVHTSIAPEPFGRVIVEAMAAGKPVVAADRGGPLDIVVEGETGFLVDPRDTEALASAIGRLLDDPALAEEMGAAGRRRARRLFGKERHARLVAEVYEEVLR